MDIHKALRTTVKTGKVYFGHAQTIKALKKGEVKLIIVASNCPEEFKSEYSKYSDIPVYQFNGNGLQLGTVCGKQFSVSTLSIIQPGSSQILMLAKQQQ